MRLAELIQHVNLPELIAYKCGRNAVRGLNRDRGGIIRDPRLGYEEQHPSFSVYRKGNVWRWKRHGSDGASGDAFDFLLAVGDSPERARVELAHFAGVSLVPWQPLGERAAHRFPDPIRQAQEALDRCAPLEEGELRRTHSLLAPLSFQDAAALDLQRRGLWEWLGLDAGKLRRDWATRDGRTLAHAGALAFALRGPDGRTWGLKVRNLGTAEQLQASGLHRYVYRIARHGAPAWCSPGYGHGDSVMIVEGELNGVAAARALQELGHCVDVQGLAGAGGVPFLHGLLGKPVYLYADPDKAGVACLDRVAKVARAAGAAEVWVLAPLSGEDFSDLCGKLGAAELGKQLMGWLQSSTIHRTISPTGDQRTSTIAPATPLHTAGALAQSDIQEMALEKYRARLRRFGGGL